jgi:putative ABC transport system ATP-binding protein
MPVAGLPRRSRSEQPALRDDVLIELEGVCKDYVTGPTVVHALVDVNLRIHVGEFVAIVGTSGSGKSTLLNILGCLDRPTRGAYRLGGISVGDRSVDERALVRNRMLGFIFQGFHLLPRTTALENVELPLVYRGLSARQRRRQALSALAQVGLLDRASHKPNQLSGGQQQRVAIARALVTRAPVLLADEPTGNLDRATTLEVMELLEGLVRSERVTLVLVTHEPEIAARADRTILVKDGKAESMAASLATLPTGAEQQGSPDRQAP